MDILEDFKNFLTGRRANPEVSGKVQEAQPAKVDKYTDVVHFIESKRGTVMDAKTSSAKGHFQFIDKTWEDYVTKNKLNFSLEDRYDYEKSKKVFDLFTQDNVNVLRKGLSRDPTDTEKYMAHKLGPGVAVKFMKATPNTSVDAIVGKRELAANKNVFYTKDGKPKKVRDVYSYFDDFFMKENL